MAIDSPPEVPSMLLIGSAGRNVGKTEFACSVIRALHGRVPVVGLKVTTVRETDGTCPRGGRGCGVCSALAGHYLLTEETDAASAKDTGRLLRAGATRVLWLRVLREHLAEGMAAVLADTGPTVFVCESNSLRHVVKPGLFLMIREHGSRTFKGSAESVRRHADRIVDFTGDGFDLDPGELDLEGNRWALQEDAAAIVLAGGGSRRMGSDKGLLSVSDRPLLQHICDQLRPNFRQLLVSARAPGSYAFLPDLVVPDREPGQGPLMGLTSGLAASDHDRNFVVACDIPRIDMTFVRGMLSAAAGRDCVVPRTADGFFEPLYAVYRKSALPVAEELLASGTRKISALFARCQTWFTDLPEGGKLVNLNTREDYEAFVTKDLPE